MGRRVRRLRDWVLWFLQIPLLFVLAIIYSLREVWSAIKDEKP